MAGEPLALLSPFQSVASDRPLEGWLGASLTALDGGELGAIQVFDKQEGDSPATTRPPSFTSPRWCRRPSSVRGHTRRAAERLTRWAQLTSTSRLSAAASRSCSVPTSELDRCSSSARSRPYATHTARTCARQTCTRPSKARNSEQRLLQVFHVAPVPRRIFAFPLLGTLVKRGSRVRIPPSASSRRAATAAGG